MLLHWYSLTVSLMTLTVDKIINDFFKNSGKVCQGTSSLSKRTIDELEDDII